MTKILVAALMITASSLTCAQTNRDIDNDGQWDYDRGGTDRDLDNDDQWDADQESRN
jgi:hypothetical protein